MKSLYKSPVISVEELVKIDILCASVEGGETPTNPTKQDNAEINKDAVNQIADLF